MSSYEKKARDLLESARAKWLRDPSNGGVMPSERIAIEVIAAALTPPEGFVLVPVEATAKMMDAAGRVVFQEAGQQWLSADGFGEACVVETQRLCYAAVLAARPGVEP